MTLLSCPSVLQQLPASDFSSKEQYSVVTGKVCKRQRGEMGRCVGRVGGPPGTAGMLGAARTAPCTAQGGAGWGQEAHWVSVHSPQRFPGTAGSTHKLKRNRYEKMDTYIYIRNNWMQMLNLVDWMLSHFDTEFATPQFSATRTMVSNLDIFMMTPNKCTLGDAFDPVSLHKGNLPLYLYNAFHRNWEETSGRSMKIVSPLRISLFANNPFPYKGHNNRKWLINEVLEEAISNKIIRTDNGLVITLHLIGRWTCLYECRGNEFTYVATHVTLNSTGFIHLKYSCRAVRATRQIKAVTCIQRNKKSAQLN